MHRRNKQKLIYEVPTKLSDLFTEVADEYINAKYCINKEVRRIICKYFGWLISYDISPMNSMLQLTDKGMPVKWVLYAKCRQDKDRGKIRYSSSCTNLLSIQSLWIDGGGFGCFSEKHYEKDDTVTLYLGNKMKPSTDPTHSEYPYALEVEPNVYITPNNNGTQLLLGAHKANNTLFESSTGQTQKKKGRPRQNNAYIPGIYVKASQRILCGNEILVDYHCDQIG